MLSLHLRVGERIRISYNGVVGWLKLGSVNDEGGILWWKGERVPAAIGYFIDFKISDIEFQVKLCNNGRKGIYLYFKAARAVEILREKVYENRSLRTP